MENSRAPSPEDLRKVFGAYATGIAVVTCEPAKGVRCAVTVNSFASVSLDPPLVLFCLDKAAFHHHRFLEAEAFAVNILAADQMVLSNRFAQETMDGFKDLATEIFVTGCPVFPGALAALDCVRDAVHEAGDHHVLIGRVVAARPPDADDPLIYFRGGYAGIRR